MDKTHGLFLVLVVFAAQTEGDTGYDFADAYEEDYDIEDPLGVPPSFDVTILNVTVVTEQIANLPCLINHLGKHKVMWTKLSYSMDGEEIVQILTYEDRVKMHDYRYSILRPKTKEWNLRINDIVQEDQGTYLCTINTDPPRSKKVVLHVKVPPGIIAEESSPDLTVQENETVSLKCAVSGEPRPMVTWHRLPADASSNHERESKACHNRTGLGLSGETLILENITRYCDDIYECEADNGYPPKVRHRMKVTVQYPPEIHMPNTLIRQSLGRDTILECQIAAFPQATIGWQKNGQKITSTTGKYETEIYREPDNRMTFSLRIFKVAETDFGIYTCTASNPHGRASGSMELGQSSTMRKSYASTPTVIVVDFGHKSTHDHVPRTSRPPRLNGSNNGGNQRNNQLIKTRYKNEQPEESRTGELNSNGSSSLNYNLHHSAFLTLVTLCILALTRSTLFSLCS